MRGRARYLNNTALNDLDLNRTTLLTVDIMSIRRRNSFYRSFKDACPEFEDMLLDRGATAAAQNKWVFEIAWEVANKGESKT